MAPSWYKRFVDGPKGSRLSSTPSSHAEQNNPTTHGANPPRAARPRFKYPALSSQAPSIRLLRLLATPSHSNRNLDPNAEPSKADPIQCELTLSYLDHGGGGTAVGYDAVSYYWGAPSSPERQRSCWILLDGLRFHVSPVVHEILSRLRTSDDRLLWIDFICIDQDNDAEKVFQVARMRDIYAHARSVTVCLTEVGDTQLLHRRDIQGEISAEGAPRGSFLVHTGIIGSPGHVFQSHFAMHPWFNRIWVVQEVLFAKRITVICGDVHMEGKYFAQTIRVAKRSISQMYDGSGDWFATVQPLLDAMQSGTGARTEPLIDLLHKFRGRKASLGVDKIFALLGLCTDDTKVPELAVDYSLPKSTVFLKVACYVIRCTDNLDILTYRSRRQVAHIRAQAETHQEPSGTPFWYPIWDDEDVVVACTRSVVPIGRLNGPRLTNVFQLHSREDLASLRPHPLDIDGCCIGTITSVFSDGSVEAVPNDALLRLAHDAWDWAQMPTRLREISNHLSSQQGPGLRAGDELWILAGSTGLAILRTWRAMSITLPGLIVLEHSDFPRFGFFEGGHISFSHIADLYEAGRSRGAHTLTKIAAVMAESTLSVITLY